jgi:hypothetical protein
MLKFDDMENRCARADVHPLAHVETEHPITECLACGMPVPMEADGDVYCNKTCEAEHFDKAMRNMLPPPLPLTISANPTVLFDLEAAHVCSCHCH